LSAAAAAAAAAAAVARTKAVLERIEELRELVVFDLPMSGRCHGCVHCVQNSCVQNSWVFVCKPVVVFAKVGGVQHVADLLVRIFSAGNYSDRL
jgi:hypothetical protein